MATKTKLKKEHPKKSKPKEDVSWILEGIVAYLQSPTWTVPVLNFVEENCGAFVDSEENKFEYTEIHGNYKKLVEGLLVHYTEELGLSESQFQQACSKDNRDIARMDANFEYIWAAEDFMLFKRLMLKNNLQVEMEALHMLKNQYLSAPTTEGEFGDEDAEMLDKFLKKSKHSAKKIKEYQRREEEDLELAIEFSRLEMERLNALAEEEKKLMEQAIKLSLETSAGMSANHTQAPTAYNDEKELPSFSSFTKSAYMSNSSTNPPKDFSPSSLDAPPPYEKPTAQGKVKEDHIKPQKKKGKEVAEEQKMTNLPPLRMEKSNSEAAAEWLNHAMKEITESPTHNSQATSISQKHNSIDPEELAKRRAYLQHQREKLLALKRKEREKQLSDYNDQKQDAQIVQSKSEGPKTLDPEEEKKLASRRAVAERLKREVINKK